MSLIFIHVPKCGGFNTGKKLHENGVMYDGHTTVAEYIQQGFGTNKMFALVRHPYSRLVSAYFYLLNGGIGNKGDVRDGEIVSKYKSFKEFVFNIIDDDLISKLRHIKPIEYFLCYDNTPIKNIFKLEQIDEFRSFLLTNNISIDLVKNNESAHDAVESYLDDNIRSEIRKIYNNDFKLFGYE